MRKRITRIRKKLEFIFQSILLIEPTLVSFAESNSRPNLNAPAIGRVDQNQIQATLLKALLVQALSPQEVDQFTVGGPYGESCARRQSEFRLCPQVSEGS
jgi:hypothetical protein